MNPNPPNDFNRRDFLKGASVATIMAMMGGVELRAQAPAATNAEPALTVIPVNPTVNFGIIGLGPWARDIIAELGKMPNAPVVALCDKFPKALTRAGDAAPKAQKYDDYKKLLENKDVQAVIVATPTHLHKEIVLAALAAGKHVYCEAPLAHTVEDAKAIAAAAKASVKCLFQSGLQTRNHPHRQFLVPFVKAGAAGRAVAARAQYHKKISWAQTSSNPDREKEINWRLDKALSTGLAGEIGIHQFDLISMLLRERPKAVTGFGSILEWKDGRDVPDTIQALVEYPSGVNLTYDASLANSFDASYEMLYGTYATLMMRGTRGWMFKEVDSPLLGWEVYAKKESFFGETGIVLRAGATAQKNAVGKNAGADDPYPNQPLYYALEDFTTNVGMYDAAVKDYISLYGESDLKGLADQIAPLKLKAAAGWKEGFEATIVGIKANEAVLKKKRVELSGDLFTL
jgi:predicted dehydrogenase